MNFRILSAIFIGFSVLVKICSFYWVFVILSCAAVALLTVFSVILSSSQHSAKVVLRNPLEQHDKVRLGLSCKSMVSNELNRVICWIFMFLDDHTKADHEHKSRDPLRRHEKMTDNKEIDSVLRNLLDFVFRDFIDVWYSQLSSNKAFTNESRKRIERLIGDVSRRLTQAPLLTLITTSLVDDVAAHSKTYHRALKTLNDQSKKAPPASKLNSPFHRRNKSDTDVGSRNWNLGNALIHKKVANSTFYSVQTDEKLMDPDKQLLELFFESSDNAFKDECLSDEALEKHLMAVLETALYFSLEPEDFKCEAVRSFLPPLLASVIGKSIINSLSDPDFINFHIANVFTNDPPTPDYLIKMIRLCNDLSELRAVRSLITREMDMKHKEAKYAGELASLKFTQKIIDMRITSLQNSNIDSGGKKNFEKEKMSLKFPLLTLDDILSKDLALSYYLDYLSILNLQKYVIFYCLVQEWKLATTERLSSIKNDHEKQQLLRDKAFNLYTEYLIPSSSNCLNVDQGLIEVLHIKIKDTFLQPEPSWFDSICKFVYEKLKNEHVFLQNFYESPAYKKLLLELEETEAELPIELTLLESKESKSDTSSGDFVIDEIDLLDPGDEASWDPLSVGGRHQRSHSDTGILISREPSTSVQHRLTSKIINTAINSSGNFAVYAIQVRLIEKDSHGVEHQKSWHIYRRYSKFLELKKLLLRRFPHLQTSALPFPKKQTFHNTNRSLIERRMVILNDFLRVICEKGENNDQIHFTILEFLEPDQDDREIHGTKVIKNLVNPLKYGMRTIKNMPDNVFGGLSRIFLHKNIEKLAMGDTIDASHSNAEFPALISFINLLDVVFDLESRSQWLKKGIHSVMAAPFISQSLNKKIQDIAQKYILDAERVEGVLCGILNNVWPNGVRQDGLHREDTTKLRTRMAAKIALFAFLSGEN